MKKNAILFSNVDREDGWVSSALSFSVDTSLSYEEIYKSLKDKLESKEIVDFVVEDNCLVVDLFEEDEDYKFLKTYWDRALVYVFSYEEDGEEYEIEYTFNQTDFILMIEK